RFFERLVDRQRLRPQVLLVHVEDRVEDRAARSGGADGGEGRPVLDHALLFAVVPDEVRDPVHVRMRTGGNRGEADRGQRREGGDTAAIAAVGGEEGERRRCVTLDCILEDGGRESVDDYENQLPARD